MHHVRALSFSTNRSARALSKGQHRSDRIHDPVRARRLLLVDPVGCHRGAPRAGDAGRALPDAPRARPRGGARRAAAPRHDRRRDPRDALGIGRPSSRSCETLGFPFVVVDPPMPLDDTIPAVSATHWAGARAATDHLLGLGHRRIAIIAGRKGWVASEERVNGYQAALAGAGVLATPTLVMQGQLRDRRTATRLRIACSRSTSLRPRSSPPTTTWRSARCAPPPSGASASRTTSPSSGSTTPSWPASSHPALTTVRQPLEEMGRMAVSLLTRLIDGQSVETLRVELATRLVIRQSTAPPPRP